MKKLIIEAPSGLDPKYKLWAREAAGEMLSLFPEYKSSFQIEFDELCRHGQTEIDQAAFDRLPDDEFKRKFVRLSNGKYLVPYASETWYLAQSSAENRANGIDAADMEKYGKLKAEGMLHRKSQDIVVSLLGSDIQPAFYGYGIEGLNAVISTPNCNDKEFFITIFMHEFGHILNATHERRPHTKDDPALGVHCTNDKCIMGESNYHDLTRERLERKRKNRPPFCDECIAAMREKLENMPGLTKAVAVSHANALPVLPHNDDNWKNGWRTHYRAVAARDKFTYHEDVKNPNFVAEITRNDGSKLNIEANNEYNLSLGAQTADGKDDIPAIKDFADVVAKAAADNSVIEFASIRDDEFKARLLIACLEASPRMKTNKAPNITPAFLKNIDPKTKARLQKALTGNRQHGNGNAPQPRPNRPPHRPGSGNRRYTPGRQSGGRS